MRKLVVLIYFDLTMKEMNRAASTLSKKRIMMMTVIRSLNIVVFGVEECEDIYESRQYVDGIFEFTYDKKWI